MPFLFIPGSKPLEMCNQGLEEGKSLQNLSYLFPLFHYVEKSAEIVLGMA